MRRFRFHLGTLVILVLVLGVGFAALCEPNEIWDSGIFTLTLGILLTSVLLAIHRTESTRAFWLGFAMFGWAYLGLSLVPSIEPRLITTKALSYIDSKVPRSLSAGLAYFEYDDGSMDLYVVNNPQPNPLYLNKGKGVFEDVTASAGLNPASIQGTGDGWRSLTDSERQWLRGSGGATENFMRIGHSILALIAAFAGGQLSRRLYPRNRQWAQGQASPQGSTSSDGSGG